MGSVPSIQFRTVNTVTVGAASATYTPPVRPHSITIRFVSSVACHVRMNPAGVTTDATTSDPYVPANSVEFLTVPPGFTLEIIQNTTGGTAWLTEALVS